MRKFLGSLAVLLIILACVSVVRALLKPSRQLAAQSATVKEADRELVARHLAEAVRFQTISLDPSITSGISSRQPFDEFHQYLETTYPLAHKAMTRETVGGASLLYTWKGSDPSLPAGILIGHQDVVPANEANGVWKQPAFAGVIANGEVWGRGTLDDKLNIIGLLEAVEKLSADGFHPARTFYLAFGQDEELDGKGAQAMAGLLKSRGVKADFVLDEGSGVTEAMLPGIQKAVAAVAIAEKGYVDLELSVAGTGGHSSAPPQHTAVGILSQAITRIEDHPFPSRVDGAIAQTFVYAGPEMSLPMKSVVLNQWLTGGLLRKVLESSATTNGQVRTTAAVNQVFGSDAPNALPALARAVVNLRLLPGDRIDDVLAHLRKAIDDPRVPMKILVGNEAPPLADIESPGGLVLQKTLRQVYPESITAPILSPGATDARNYSGLTPNLFRFMPVTLNDEALELMHGKNERVAVKDLGKAVQFYEQLIVNLSGVR